MCQPLHVAVNKCSANNFETARHGRETLHANPCRTSLRLYVAVLYRLEEMLLLIITSACHCYFSGALNVIFNVMLYINVYAYYLLALYII